MKSAIIENNKVINIIAGETEDSVPIPENENIEIGFSYQDGVWTNPNPPAPPTEEEIIFLKKMKIEEHIYKYYPEKKQTQDLKWSEAFRIKLGVYGVVDVDKKIYTMGLGFFTGKTFDESISLVFDKVMIQRIDSLEVEPTEDERIVLEADIKDKLETLLGIAIRTEWAERCVVEGRKAIMEEREPVYMEFPDISKTP